jgi:poly [ADP-ribose] polymerase 2/3/4
MYQYTRIEINYEPMETVNQEDPASRRGSTFSVASPTAAVSSKLAPAVEKLMNFIFDNKHVQTTMAQLEYDQDRMPLGNLSQNTLQRGFQTLKELAGLLGNIGYGNNNQRVEELSNQYYTLIPHVFNRRTRPPTLNQFALIKREIDLLENLTDLRLANEIMEAAQADSAQLALADRQYQGLGLEEMTALDENTREYAELSDYLTRSAGQTHGLKYEVEAIFRIERKGEANKFSQSSFANLSKDRSRRALLWHGSRSTNFPGILSQGLRIAPPEAPASGYMFGKGIYLANISTKSANYCFSNSSDDTGLLLLCEAELGKPVLKLKHASYTAGEEAKEQDAISTWGVGMTTVKGYKDAGCVHPDLRGVEMPDVKELPGPSNETGLSLMYDEFIAYSVEQVQLRYLFRVKMNAAVLW